MYECIHLNSILVDVLTEGGRMTVKDKILLGTYVKEMLCKLTKNNDRTWEKVPITTSTFEDGRRVTTEINIIKYTKEDLVDVTVAVAMYLRDNKPKIIY